MQRLIPQRILHTAGKYLSKSVPLAVTFFVLCNYFLPLLDLVNVYAVVDVTPPTITNVAVDKYYVKAGTNITITADVTDSSGIAAVSADFSYNLVYTDRPSPTSVSMTNTGGDTYQVIYTVPASWNEGTMYIKVAARDGTGGNWVRSSEYVEVLVDNTPPEKPSMYTIYKGHNPLTWEDIGCDSYTNTTQVSFEWIPSSEPDIAGYYFGTKFNDHHQYFSHPNNIKTANMTPGNNPYYYTVIAVDKAGNESETSDHCNLILDQNAPSTTLDSPLDDSFWNKAIEIEGTSTDDFEIREVNLHYKPHDSADPWTLITTLSNPFDTAVYNWNSSWTPPEGHYDIKASATDEAGNIETSAYATNVTYDITAPDVEINAPHDGDYIAGILDIIGTITDENPHHYWLVAQGSSGYVPGFPGVVNETASLVNELLHSWDTAGSSDGLYTIKLEARDSANNKDPGSVHWINVTVDNTPPVVVITSPIDGAHVRGTITITGTIIEINLAQYTLSLFSGWDRDEIWRSGDRLKLWEVTGNTNSLSHNLNTTAFPNGQYTLLLSAKDLAGNGGSHITIRETDCSIHAIRITIDNTEENTNNNSNQGGEGTGGATGGTGVIHGLYNAASAQGEEKEEKEEEENGEVLGTQDCETKSKVSGYIYEDANDNSQKDEDETGIANVSVNIYYIHDDETREYVRTITSDENGYWEAELCPGDFEAEVDKGSLEEGASLKDETPLRIGMSEGENTGDVNFAITKSAPEEGKDSFNWWWLLLIPVVALVLYGLSKLLSRREEGLEINN